MKKLISILKTILWALGVPYIGIMGLIKKASIKKKVVKYKKFPEEFLDTERYTDVFKLAKAATYLKRIKVETKLGNEKLANKPQLIIANHRSDADTMIMFMTCYEQLNNNFVFIAKKELKDSKYGFIYDYIDTLYLDRANLRDGVRLIDEQVKLLKQGKIIVVFPEGTRNHNDELLEFKSGAFEPAYKALCSVQPILFFNTEQHLECKKETKVIKPIKMLIMKPVQQDKFIAVDRTIFARNMQKEMQTIYDKNK